MFFTFLPLSLISAIFSCFSIAERFGKPGEFIEGDIKKSSFDKFEKEGFISKREVLLLPKYRWEKAQIPYTLDPSLSRFDIT